MGLTIDPFLEGGTGYTWFGKAKITTINGGYGVNIPVSEKVSIKVGLILQACFQRHARFKISFPT